MIKAVIFDMDGVIIDSEKIHSLSYETVLKDYGKEPKYTPNGLIHTPGIGAHGNWQNLKVQYNLEENLEILVEKKRAVHQKLIKKTLKPMSGLLQLLDLLKKHRIKIAVGSSANIQAILLVVDELGIKKYFDAIVSGQSVMRKKPYPDIFLKVAEEINILPSHCLVLEDSKSGVIAAKNAGMKVIAVQNNYTENQDHTKADKIVSSLQSVTMELINSL